MYSCYLEMSVFNFLCFLLFSSRIEGTIRHNDSVDYVTYLQHQLLKLGGSCCQRIGLIGEVYLLESHIQGGVFAEIQLPQQDGVYRHSPNCRDLGAVARTAAA